MTTPMKEGYTYEAELIPIGMDQEGDETSDEERWDHGQTQWNIFVTLRDQDGEYIDEILDLDIPVEMESLARWLFQVIDQAIQAAHAQGVELY